MKKYLLPEAILMGAGALETLPESTDQFDSLMTRPPACWIGRAFIG